MDTNCCLVQINISLNVESFTDRIISTRYSKSLGSVTFFTLQSQNKGSLMAWHKWSMCTSSKQTVTFTVYLRNYRSRRRQRDDSRYMITQISMVSGQRRQMGRKNKVHNYLKGIPRTWMFILINIKVCDLIESALSLQGNETSLYPIRVNLSSYVRLPCGYNNLLRIYIM